MNLIASPEKRDQSSDSITDNIVSTVADKTGMDPIELPPLYGAIEPDALTAICDSTSTGRPLTVEFEYAGHLITVQAAEEVEISVEEI